MTSSTNNALYLNLKRKVAVLNYNYKYPADVFTLLNSTELLNVIQLFLQQRHHSNRSNSFEDLTAADYIETRSEERRVGKEGRVRGWRDT